MSRDTCHASDRRHGRVASTHITIRPIGRFLVTSSGSPRTRLQHRRTRSTLRRCVDASVRRWPVVGFSPIHSETWAFSPRPGTPGRGEPVCFACQEPDDLANLCHITGCNVSRYLPRLRSPPCSRYVQPPSRFVRSVGRWVGRSVGR